MRLTNTVTAIALGLALAGGSVAPSFADVPKAPQKISDIDANKDKKITKEEYLAFMAKAFDSSAGSKGYCTYEEIAKGFNGFGGMTQW